MKLSEKQSESKQVISSKSGLHPSELVERFRALEEVDLVMDKLSSLMIFGETAVESRLSSSLERIMEALEGKASETSLKEVLQSFENDLNRYEQWILQNHQIVTAFSLRTHIQNGTLNYNDLRVYLKFLIHLKHKTTDDYYKADLLLTRICEGLSPNEVADMVDSLCKSKTTLHPEAQELVNKIYSACSELKALATFDEMIEGSLLGQARALKQDLGTAFWHPVAMKAVAQLNVTLRTVFDRLFYHERQFIRSVCNKLLQRSIRSIVLDSGKVLSVDEAMKLVEESEHLLNENYNTNTQTLSRLAKMGAYMRWALNKLLEEQATQKISPSQIESFIKEIDPLLTSPKDLDEENLKRQLSEQLKTIQQLLSEQSTEKHSEVIVIRLAHTPLMLNSKEVRAILSEGKAVDNHLLLQEYKMIRTCISVLAQMQESTAIFNSGNKSAYNVNIISLLLAIAQRLQGELEVLSHKAQQENDSEGSIEMLTLRRRLQNANIELWRIASQMFPVLKLKNVGIYIHN